MESKNQKSLKKSSRVVGISLLAMLVLSIVSLLVFLEPALDSGDIQANIVDFYIGIGGYIIILILDAIIAVSLFVIFKPKNKTLALVVTISRLMYTITMFLSIILLAFQLVEVYNYGYLVAYAFFCLHVFVLGYAVFTSGYLPIFKFIGIVLMFAMVAYVILTYGEYFIPSNVLEILTYVAFVPAFLGEPLLGLFLLIRASKIEQNTKELDIQN